MRPHLLLLSVAFISSAACSDPKCRPGETKIGTVCFERDKDPSDASPDGLWVDGAVGSPSGSKRDATTSQPPDAADTATDASRADSGEVVDASAAAEGDAAAPETDAAEPVVGDAGSMNYDAAVPEPTMPAATCLTDSDGDGFGVEPMSAPCPSTGQPPKSGDCNDKAPSAFPGGSETCGDGVDNDCNGQVDDGTPEQCNGIDDDCNPSTADGAGACGTFQCRNAKCLTACSADSDCVAGLHCVGSACEGTQLGANCNQDEQCASGSCAGGKCSAKVGVKSSCDSTGDCQAKLSCIAKQCKADDGATCGADDECQSVTCVSGKCITAKVTVNKPCDSATDCSSGLSCVDSVCKGNPMQPCSDDNECQSGACITTCAEGKQALGGPCNSPADCGSTLACDGAKCKADKGHVCAKDDDCLTNSCNPSLRCADKVDYNQACDSAPDCAAPYVCAGKCLKSFEASCFADAECGQGNCVPTDNVGGKRCRNPAGLNAFCIEANDCSPDLQCNNFGNGTLSYCKLPLDAPCPAGCAPNDACADCTYGVCSPENTCG